MKRVPKFLVVLLLAACGKLAPKDPAALRAEIQTRDDAWSVAFIAGDSAALAGFYANDVVSMEPGAADVVGRDAVVKGLVTWTRTRPDTILSIETIITSLSGNDSTAYESGTTLFVGRAKGDSTAKVGRALFKYITLWAREQDGVWRIKRDLAVPDLLPPEGAR